MKIPQDSPVEQRRKELPRGDANWPGYAYVYAQIQSACECMAQTKYVYLSDEHVNAMAIIGCGHEGTMKYELMRLRDRGFARTQRTRQMPSLKTQEYKLCICGHSKMVHIHKCQVCDCKCKGFTEATCFGDTTLDQISDEISEYINGEWSEANQKQFESRLYRKKD